MGVKGFSKAFKHSKIVKWTDLKNKTIAVDAMTELYRLALGASSVRALTDKYGNPTLHISGFLSNILELYRNNVKPIYVFDYDNDSKSNAVFHNPSKVKEVSQRRTLREANRKRIEDLKANEDVNMFSDDDEELSNAATISTSTQSQIDALEKRTFTPTKQMINDIKLIMNWLNIPYIEAPAGFEGEHIAAFLASQGYVNGVYSGDTDVIPFGSPILWRRNPRDKKIYEYKTSDLYNQINTENKAIASASRDDLVKICVILGTDFAAKTRGIGPKTVIKKFNTVTLSAEQKAAVVEYNKQPDANNINVENAEGEPFILDRVTTLIDWLETEKSFNRIRITNQFKKSGLYPGSTRPVLKLKTKQPKSKAVPEHQGLPRRRPKK